MALPMPPAVPTRRLKGGLLLLPLLFCAAAASPVQASSPQAWAAYGQQVLQACRAASTLRNSRAAGERVDLPTSAGGAPTSVLLLEGTYPQAHMAGRKGLEVCVYDGTSRKARVAEADRLLKGSRQP